MLSNLFAPLGNILIDRETTYWPHPREIQLQLKQLGRVYELSAAPADCIHIGRDLVCSAHGVRFPIKILTWPVAVWTGRGKYRKKAVEIVELIVDMDLIERASRHDEIRDAFCSAAQKGWAYDGASKRKKRTKSSFA